MCSLSLVTLCAVKDSQCLHPTASACTELHENCCTCSPKGETSEGTAVELNFRYPHFSFSLLFYLIFSVKGIQ